jgi:phytoene desaturase
MDQKVDLFKIPEQITNFNDGDHAERVLVIGSGFGGLASAIRMAKKGYQVQVCRPNHYYCPISTRRAMGDVR